MRTVEVRLIKRTVYKLFTRSLTLHKQMPALSSYRVFYGRDLLTARELFTN